MTGFVDDYPESIAVLLPIVFSETHRERDGRVCGRGRDAILIPAEERDDAQAKVGETNAYAGMRATNVTVTVKFAEGVSYYCNGTEFAVFDTPTKVGYNSVFTAKINDTSKYEGTPLINGKNSFIVTEDATLTVSGVTPIPDPPAPEPVIGDTGLTLTDILLIVAVILIAILVMIVILRLNRS